LASPREIGRLLEMIAKGQAVSPDESKQMMDIMREQFYSSRIPHYLPNPWGVPHKTGDFPPYLANDVGILDPGKAMVVLVVFNSHYQGQYPLLEDAVARIALEIYNFYNH
jgi:beta-lactamase class A